VSVERWHPPDWHVTVPGPARPVPVAEPPIAWPGDGIEFALTTIVVVLTGPLIGLLWAAVGPQLSLVNALSGSGPAYNAEVGADFYFLLLTGGAGLLGAAVAVALRRDGPGVLLGLVVGGFLAALVANRVAYLVHHGDTLATLRHLGVSLSVLQRFGVDPFFKVRAEAVLVAWPMAALLLFVLALAVRGRAR
jgi:hypothetical protein